MKLNKISADMVSRRPDQTAEWLNRLSRQVDIIEANAEATKKNPYVLPIASTYTLGAIKVGANLSITPEGVLSALSPASYDYNLLFNKPQINSVTLTGNTSLHDLGIDIPTKTSELINNGADNTSTYVEHDELATVATSGSYADLINKPTIGNATLTIQKNSTDVGTFTANATSNKTIDISVPTQTSDITNNGADGTSTYVEADDLATVATTGSYNDLLDQPTIGDATLTIQRNGTTAQTFTANSTTNKSVDIQAPVRVNMTGTLQTASWRRSVIALCKVSSADKGQLDSFSSGRITFHRNNGVAGVFYLDYTIDQRYSPAYGYNFTYSSNINLLREDADIDSSLGFRPCVFKKDNVWYAGIELCLATSQCQTVIFDGEYKNISIFGLDYYSYPHTSGGTSYPAEILNQEVYDSLVYDTADKWTVGKLAVQTLRIEDGKIVKGNAATTATIPSKTGTLAMTSDIGNATLTIQKNGTNVDTFTANATSNKTINITVPTTAADVNALPDSTKYAANLSLTIDSSTFVVTGQLKDQDGNNIGSAQTIDLPLESVVVSGSYDSATKEVVLVLESGSEIRFSVADLVSGLQSEITSANPLDADLVDDSTSTNKFVTSSDITTWNGKQDALTAGSNIQISGSTISATDTTYSAGSGITLTGTTFSADTSVLATQTDLSTGLSGKQDILTAGTNINIVSDTISTQTRGIEYIVGTQASATNLWTGVSTDNGCSSGTLYTGKTIVYYLPQAGNSSAASLDLTLPDGSTTGAIALRRLGTGTITTHYAAGNVIPMTYDGTYWKVTPYIDNNTTCQLRYQNLLKAETAIRNNYLACGTSAGYKELTSGSTFDINYPLLWNGSGATIAADGTSTGLYRAIESRTLRNNKSGWTGDSYKVVYVFGTLSGNTFTVDTDVFTQTVPTTEDGKVYTPIGMAYSTYQIYFFSTNEYWQYKNGEFRPISHTPAVMTGADSGTAGTSGLVPAPAAGDDTKFLSGDGLWKTVSQYSLPIASSSTLGGIKVGNRLTIDSGTGVLSADSQTDNNFTTTLKDKLDGIAAGAEVNVQSDWTEADNTSDAYIQNKPNLATVATSGSYNDLSNKPTIPTVNDATLTIQKNGTTVNTFTANASSNVTANISVPTKTSDITNDSGFITSADTVAKADQLTTARTIALGTGATGTATSFNGTSNITIPVTRVYETYLAWGNQDLDSKVSCVDAAMGEEFSANRLAYMNPGKITVEYSRDGGSTWVDYGLSDTDKVALVTTSKSVYTGGTSSDAAGNYQSRVNLNPTNPYMTVRKLFLYISTGGVSNAQVLIEKKAMGASTYETVKTATISGWSGWNSIPLSLTLGGSTSWSNSDLRLTFSYNGKNASYPNAQLNVAKIRLYGETAWSAPSNLATNGHLYSYDASQNATFPANVKIDGSQLQHSSYGYTLPSKNGTLALTSDLPTVNNATLTIQKNGTTVNTFTANASSNVTADIAVPTATSDLTNDSGFTTTATAQDFAVQEGSTNPVFDNMTPLSSFEWDVSDTVYRPIYQMENTGWAYDNMDVTVAYRITVTGSGISTIADVIDRWHTPNQRPATSMLHRTLSTALATSGFRFLRAVCPTASYINNNTYKIGQELYMYNATARHVKIEVFKTNSKVTWNTTKPAGSIYAGSTTYQSVNNIEPYSARGWVYRGASNVAVNSADAASRITDYEASIVGNSSLLAGATALVSGHFAFLAEDGKVYDISDSTKAISVGEAKIGLVASAVSANTAITSSYWRTISRPTASQYGYFSHDTMALGDRVYLRCTMDSSGKIYSDNYLSKTMGAGYTWMPMGVMTASNTFYADTRFPMFYTLNSAGKLTHINGEKTTPDITITNTDPGEGVALGEDEYIAVYGSPSMIGTSRLENGAVTTTKIDANAVTAAKIDFSTLNFGNYSNTEQDTGFTWLDGSPIYKKTITHTTGLAAGGNNIPHGITNLGIVVNKEVIGYDSVTSTTAQIPMATFSSSTPSGNSISSWTITTTDVQIYSSFAYSNTVYITLYYTKSS